MNLLSFIRKPKIVRCYPYCLGLDYDRQIGIKQEQWEENDIDLIAQLMVKDLEKLKIDSKIVDEKYIPSNNENLLALKAGIMWIYNDYYYSDYHVIVKKQDGYWYSKFGQLDPERLPLGTDVQSWNWRDSHNKVKENHYNSKIVYIVVQC
jgi:hypothetical protein